MGRPGGNAAAMLSDITNSKQTGNMAVESDDSDLMTVTATSQTEMSSCDEMSSEPLLVLLLLALSAASTRADTPLYNLSSISIGRAGRLGVDRHGYVYVANMDVIGSLDVVKINISSGAVAAKYHIAAPSAIAVDADDNLYFGLSPWNTTIKVAQNGTVLSRFTAKIVGPQNAAVVGELIFISNMYDDHSQPNFVSVINRTSGAVLLTFTVSGYYIGAVTADDSANIVYVAVNEAVNRYNMSGALTSVFRADSYLTVSNAMTVDRSGHVYWADFYSGDIVQFNAHGDVVHVYTSTVGQRSIYGIIIHPLTTYIVASDATNRCIIVFKPVNVTTTKQDELVKTT